MKKQGKLLKKLRFGSFGHFYFLIRPKSALRESPDGPRVRYAPGVYNSTKGVVGSLPVTIFSRCGENLHELVMNVTNSDAQLLKMFASVGEALQNEYSV